MNITYNLVVRVLTILIFLFSFKPILAKDFVTCEKCLDSDKNINSLEELNHNLKKSANCLQWNENFNGKYPEDYLKNEMAHLSDDEVFIRLILAESTASGCYSEQLARAIAITIKNRVSADKESFGKGRNIAFKPYQYRSSTGGCDVAQRDLFLCPRRNEVSQKRLIQVEKIYNEVFKKKEVSNNLAKSYNYFFPNHFNSSKNCAKWQGVLPAWAKSKKSIEENAIGVKKSCAIFYRD